MKSLERGKKGQKKLELMAHWKVNWFEYTYAKVMARMWQKF